MNTVPDILLVDDEQEIVESLMDFFNFLPYNFHSACSGIKVLEMMEEKKFDILITDIRMPDINGIELMKRVSQIQPDCIFIVITGHGDINTAIEALKNGALNYIRKPINLDELKLAIEQGLNKLKLKRDLYESKEWLSITLSSIGEGVIATDVIGNIVFINPVAEQLTGWKIKEAKNHTFKEVFNIIDDENSEILDNSIKKVLKHGNISELKTKNAILLAKNDKKLPVTYTCSPIKNIQDEIMGAVLVLRDITNLKQADKELRKKEQMLYHQDKMASLGRVTAGVAHEIRNPLSGINIFLSNLEKYYKNESNSNKIFDIIQMIKTSSNKIEAIIKRVIDFSRPMKPDIVLCDINQPVKEACNLYKVTLNKSHIAFNTKLKDDLPWCNIDSQMIEQVVLNLLSNASESLKTSGEFKIIEVQTFFEDNNIKVSVSDSGQGILKENKEKIFEPFYSTKHSGTGIGLNICKRIIKDHKGTIKVKKSNWNGAKFIVSIPKGE